MTTDSANNTLRPRAPMKLDDLLSPEALQRLKEDGFVSFRVDDPAGTITGWFARKTKTVVEKERVAISMPLGID